MGPQRSNINVDELVRRIREKIGRPAGAPAGRPVGTPELKSVDWNRIGDSLAGADRASHVWTTTPRMEHYPWPVRWIASILGKAILYFNQVVTKPQQEFNLATVQTLAALKNGLNDLDLNQTQLRGGVEALALGMQALSDSIEAIASRMNATSAAVDSLRQLPAQVSAMERILADLSNVPSRVTALEQLPSRVTALEQLPSRVTALEQLPARVAALETLPSRVTALELLPQRLLALEQLQARVSAAEQALTDIPARLKTVEEDTPLIRSHSDALSRLLQALGELRQQIASQELRTTSLLEEARKRLPKPFDKGQLEKFSDALETMEDALYLAFEDRFRGQREEIKARMNEYVATIRQAGAGVKDRPILDVGCGRGEWLELLKELNLEAYGIDSNKAMVKECVGRGLRVTRNEVMEYLDEVRDESLGAITGFHIIEHLPMKAWLRLFDESLRVLKKGGVAIFETPNPGNVIVGSRSFYLDPTHRNPLPSELIQFMAEQRGFGSVDILNLHPVAEANHVRETTEVARRFNLHFYGPTDYAVIARKL